MLDQCPEQNEAVAIFSQSPNPIYFPESIWVGHVCFGLTSDWAVFAKSNQIPIAL